MCAFILFFVALPAMIVAVVLYYFYYFLLGAGFGGASQLTYTVLRSLSRGCDAVRLCGGGFAHLSGEG